MKLAKTGLRALDLEEPLTRNKILHFLRSRNIYAGWKEGHPTLIGLNRSAEKRFLEVLNLEDQEDIRDLNAELRNLVRQHRS
jgi:hypothetical protein